MNKPFLAPKIHFLGWKPCCMYRNAEIGRSCSLERQVLSLNLCLRCAKIELRCRPKRTLQSPDTQLSIEAFSRGALNRSWNFHTRLFRSQNWTLCFADRNFSQSPSVPFLSFGQLFRSFFQSLFPSTWPDLQSESWSLLKVKVRSLFHVRLFSVHWHCWGQTNQLLHDQNKCGIGRCCFFRSGTKLYRIDLVWLKFRLHDRGLDEDCAAGLCCFHLIFCCVVCWMMAFWMWFAVPLWSFEVFMVWLVWLFWHETRWS